MANGEQTAVLDGIRQLYAGDSVAGLAPGVLLHRYATRRDDASFAAIVARHGPMVLGVCRRSLRDPHDVEDAFQATFLILVEKAGEIRDAEGLGPWLHGVARRVATRARARAIRRRATEPNGLAVDPAAPSDDPDHSELCRIVDDEIGRLPDRYRRPVVLCDLEGVTQAEAARRLDWTEGTVRGRLARARQLLRSRLTRRGLVGSASMASLFTAETASAARLVETMIRGGVGGVSTSAAGLAREVLVTMTRLKLIGLGLGAMVAGMVLAGGAMVAAQGPRPAPVPKVGKAVVPPSDVDPDLEKLRTPRLEDLPRPSEPEPEPASSRRIAVGDLLTIEVLEALPGRPLTGNRIVRPDGTVGLGFYGDLKLAGLTRREAKVAVIEHMRQYLTDGSLGLIVFEEERNAYVRLHPSRSNRVYVDDSPNFDPRPVRAGYARPGGPSKPTTTATARVDDDPKLAASMTFRPGDLVLIEVLKALPGRPITGERPIRPDGTVNLGFYGDFKLSGLTRAEAKVKLIEYFRQWLSDETLGLIEKTPDGKTTRVPPDRSTCLFITELEPSPPNSMSARVDELDRKLDRILGEIEAMKANRPK